MSVANGGLEPVTQRRYWWTSAVQDPIYAETAERDYGTVQSSLTRETLKLVLKLGSTKLLKHRCTGSWSQWFRLLIQITVSVWYPLV